MLLIWLLVLAVPAQAISAMSMAHCGPNHREAESSSHLNARSEHFPEEANGTSVQSRGAAELPEAVVSSGAGGGSKFAHASKHKCSACASCCSAAAIIGAPVVLPVASVTEAVFAAVVPTVDALSADGPERPPKSPPA